ATEKARFPAWAIVLIVVSAVVLIVGGVMIRWWLSKSDSSARGELDGFIFQDKRRNARARANVQAYYKGRNRPILGISPTMLIMLTVIIVDGVRHQVVALSQPGHLVTSIVPSGVNHACPVWKPLECCVRSQRTMGK
ncbi:hypothetical protein FOZ62_006305, partial [Perkinsus olseni]